MNVKLVFKVLGHILRIESVFLLLPAIVALIYGESPLPFLLTALLLLCRLDVQIERSTWMTLAKVRSQGP